jgi:hypothetical protein
MGGASALIIGEAPSRNSREPIDGRCGRRLERLAGIAEGELGWWFALGNLLPAWPGSRERRPGPHNSPGDLFDLPTARENWRALVDDGFLDDFDYVVLLGQRVRAAAGLAELGWFRWVPRYGHDCPPHYGLADDDPVDFMRRLVRLLA